MKLREIQAELTALSRRMTGDTVAMRRCHRRNVQRYAARYHERLERYLKLLEMEGEAIGTESCAMKM